MKHLNNLEKYLLETGKLRDEISEVHLLVQECLQSIGEIRLMIQKYEIKYNNPFPPPLNERISELEEFLKEKGIKDYG